MKQLKSPAPRPCESCPYRRDVPSGVWSAEEYQKLRAYDGPTFAQATSLFQCHQNTMESGQARLCAGWVATHGPQELLSLRIGASFGHVDPEVFDYTTDVSLFSSGQEACEHGMRDIENPGEAAINLIAKIAGKREDIEL